MKPILVSMAKKTAYVFAGLVVIAVLLVVVSRIVTPYLDVHRGEIEQWAGELLHAPIQIENARISWFQYQPGVALQNVMLLDQKSREPVFQVQTIKVFFSIPKSLWQRKLVMSGILVSGAELVVRQNAAGEYSVQGLPSLGADTKTPLKMENRIRDVLGWLSLQPYMLLRDIDVRLNSIGQKRFFTLHNLRIQNNGIEHGVLGEAVLHQDIATELSVAATVHGNVEDWQHLEGKLYVAVKGLSLSQWLKGRSYQNVEVKKGLLSAQVWATWREGTFKNIQSTLELLNLALYSGTKKTTETFKRISGDFGWKTEGDNRIVAGDDILIDWESRLWPASSFYLKLVPDTKQQWSPVVVNVGYLDLGDVREILRSATGLVPADILKSLADINLKGNIENIAAVFDPNNTSLMPTMVQGKYSQISFNTVRKDAGVKNLSGTFIWQDKEGSVTLDAGNVVLYHDGIFAEPIQLDQLVGTVRWQRADKQAWVINIDKLQLLNHDLVMNLGGSLDLDASWQPVANLKANFSIVNAAHVSKYLPVKVFSKNLVEWLHDAFTAGSVDDAALSLRGKLADFPFDKKNGEFKITSNVHNIKLHYAPDWPDIDSINGGLIFNGRQILIDIASARMLDINIGKINAEIPYLGDDKPAILTVKAAPIHTDFTQGLNYLHQSPLKKTIGKMFRSVSMSGPMDLTLSLVVPLENTDNTKVKGEIDFINSKMNLVPWSLEITKLTGHVDFTDNTTTATNIQAELFGKPLRLDLANLKPAKGSSIVQATVTNEIDLREIESWLKISFASTASGSANFTTKIDLALDQPIALHIESTLRGITLNLPEKYGKTIDEIRLVKADMIMQDGQPMKVKLNYAELLNAALILDEKKGKFTLLGANLRLGAGAAEWPQSDGLYITGTLLELDQDKIKAYLSQTGGEKSGLMLKKIDMTIDKLDLYGIKLGKTDLKVVPAANDWVVTIDSDAVAGDINIPVAWSSAATIKADLSHIDVDKISGDQVSQPALVAHDLPSIEFSTDSLTYDGAYIGAVNFSTTPTAKGLSIDELTISSPNLKMDAGGEWSQAGKNNVTHLRGKANTKNVSALLSQLHFDAHNFVSSDGNVEFDLNWSESPSSLSLAALSGKASINMGKGRIVEVSQSSDAKMDLGRLLNLFSLQSIPRRLSLDFSDVFQKGYSFDTLRADFIFNRGDATTNNMRFDGTIAKVEIRGRIGLSKKDIDLILSVTPYVTSSIPVAATLLTGQPVIGIAAWAVNKVISGEVSKAATYYYSVAGSWTNPDWSMIQKAKASN